MAKNMTAGFYDGGLNAIAGSTTYTICSAEPIDIADIINVALASVVVDATDFTIGDHATSGRQVAIAAQSDIPITTSGTANHVVVDDGTDMLVTTADDIVLTAGGTVSAPEWIHRLVAPV